MLENGRSISSVSTALGINQQNLYEWQKHYGSQKQTERDLVLELKLAKKKLKEVEEERDILKKALSIFSRQI